MNSKKSIKAMPDREKVIKAIESHIAGMQCEDCPYKDECDYTEEMPAVLGDVLDLLKQEPKMVVQTTSTIRCPGCGKQITNRGSIHKEIKYCWKCGQGVKWND